MLYLFSNRTIGYLKPKRNNLSLFQLTTIDNIHWKRLHTPEVYKAVVEFLLIMHRTKWLAKDVVKMIGHMLLQSKYDPIWLRVAPEPFCQLAL